MNAQVRKFTAKRIFLLLEILSQVFDRLRLGVYRGWQRGLIIYFLFNIAPHPI